MPLRQKLTRRFEHEPFVWALLSILGTVGSRLRNQVLSSLLRAPAISVGAGSTFRGVRHIRFGTAFHAHGSVWIEAVGNYRGQAFNPQLSFGDRVSASDDLHISCINQVTLGDDILLGSRVYISDHNHGDYRGDGQADPDTPPALRLLGGGGPVQIGSEVWIGHNVCIIGPCTIGAGSIIGANSVVRGDIPPNVIAVGSPARVVRRYDKHSEAWMKDFT